MGEAAKDEDAFGILEQASYGHPRRAFVFILDFGGNFGDDTE